MIGRMASKCFPFIVSLAVLVVAACSTAAQRKAADIAAINKQAAQEIKRICALPEPERQAEIKRVKDESGVVVYCGKE